jgi:hypothetical protein
MAAIPDFGGLASAQQAANDDATRRTTWSQRPDQSNVMGSTTWNQTPDGRWINNTSLSGAAQGVFDTSMAGRTNLSGQVGAGLNTNGLMDWGSTDLTGNLGTMPQVGQYNQQVIDAWNNLNKPGLDQQDSAARARAAAMGITLGSNANNDIERNLGANRNDASNKAILAGYTQGNTEYDQALRARQQGYTENLGKSTLMNSERQQQLGERKDAYSAAVAGNSNLGSQIDSLNPNKWNTTVPTGAAYIPQTIYGAAQDTFNAQRQNENAEIAGRQNTASTAAGLLGAAGGLSGLGSAASSIWGGAQSAWNWGNNAYDTWNINNNVLTPADQMNYGL